MTNDKKQRLGIQEWDDEKVEMFEGFWDCLSLAYEDFFTSGHVHIDIVDFIENLTGKTFEEIQTIMEGEGT